MQLRNKPYSREYSSKSDARGKGLLTRNRGFPKLNLSQIELIELIWMTLGVVKLNSGVTSKLPIIKEKLPCDNGISYKHIFTVYSK